MSALVRGPSGRQSPFPVIVCIPAAVGVTLLCWEYCVCSKGDCTGRMDVAIRGDMSGDISRLRTEREAGDCSKQGSRDRHIGAIRTQAVTLSRNPTGHSF